MEAENVSIKQKVEEKEVNKTFFFILKPIGKNQNHFKNC